MTRTAIAEDWDENHPVLDMGICPLVMMMVCRPRTADELETVWRLVQRSYAFARGELRPIA